MSTMAMPYNNDSEDYVTSFDKTSLQIADGKNLKLKP